MIEIVYEFLIKEGASGQFELLYGPGGAWSKLFAQWSGFRGTTVLRDANNPRRYLTIDLWETVGQWEQALSERETEYTDLETTFGEWVESKIEVGTFRVLAQATVRSQSRVGRSKAGEVRRRNRRPIR